MFKFLLYPFSFREYLLTKNKRLSDLLNGRWGDLFLQKIDKKAPFGPEVNRRLQKHFEEYLVFGGYPAVVLAKTKEEKIKILESILENYLLREIKALLNLQTKTELLKLAELLSTQIGNLVSYQGLSLASTLKYKEVLKHLKVLENTFIINLLKPFYKNPRTELTKTPKVYFLDNGFRNYLLSDFKKIEKRSDTGQLVENFVLQKEGEIIPIEVKYSPAPTLGKSFYSFLEKFIPRKAFIFTQGYFAIKKIGRTQVFFVPVYYL